MVPEREEAITVRRMRFEFPEGLDPLLIEGQPEESYVNVGLSLLLPYLEPYLIRTMREARKVVSAPALRADIDLFNAQEGQHYRQHIRFNEAIRRPGLEALAALKAELDADYRRFTETRSLSWNLAYAEGFEAFTTAAARFSFEAKLLHRMCPAGRAIFEWHLVEELEHRTVAFDVYEHVGKSYLYRLVVGLFAQWHLNRFVLRACRVIIQADRAGFDREYGGVRAAFRRLWPLVRLSIRGLWPKIFATYLPWYTPHAITMPESVRVLGAHYARLALPPGRAGESVSDREG